MFVVLIIKKNHNEIVLLFKINIVGIQVYKIPSQVGVKLVNMLLFKDQAINKSQGI